MSKQTIQTKIEQIRNESQQYANTRGRVADLLTLLNDEKLDREGVLAVLDEVTNIAPEFFEYLETGVIVGEGLTKLTQPEAYTSLSGEERILSKFLGYKNPDGTDNPLDSADIGKYQAAAGGYTADKELALDIKAEQGSAGRGITSITKSGTEGAVDTYTITFSDGTQTTFTVSNGVNGTNGKTTETWTAKSFPIGSTVYSGNAVWENPTTAAVAGDVPGTSTVWVPRIEGASTNTKTTTVDLPIKPKVVEPIYHVGQRVIANGVIEANASSVYIEVDLTQFKAGFNIIGRDPSYLHFAYYDVSGNYLLGTNNVNNANFGISLSTFPAGAVTLKLTVSITTPSKKVTVIDAAVLSTTLWQPPKTELIDKINGKLIVAEAINGVAKSTIERLKTLTPIRTSKNILNPSMVIEGWKTDTAPNTKNYLFDASASVIVVEIDNTKTYRIPILSKPAVYFILYWLDASGNYLSQINTTGTSITLTPPANSKYAVFTYKFSGYNPNGVLTMYEYDNIDKIDYAYDDYKEEVFLTDVKNDLTYKNISSPNYLNTLYVKSYDRSFGMAVLEIPVSGGETLLVWREKILYNTTEKSWQEYDANNTLVYEEVLYQTTLPARFERKTKPETRKVRLTLLLGLNQTKTIAQQALTNYVGVFATSPFFPKQNAGKFINTINGVKVYDSKEIDRLNGRVLVAFGDSITQFGSTTSGGSWVNWIEKKSNLHVYNYGLGSAWFKNKTTTDDNSTDNSISANNTVSTQVRKFLAAGVVPDIAVITGGTNDAHSPALMVEGDFNTAYSNYATPENLDKLKIYDTIVWAVAKIRSVNPNCKIYLASPIKALNQTIKPHLITFRNNFKLAASELGCEFIDFYNSEIMDIPATGNIWFNPENNDTLHPSRRGVNAMGAMALQKIITTYRYWADEDFSEANFKYNGQSN